MLTIADRVKKLIEINGLSVNAAAVKCGIKPPRLYDIVKGKTKSPTAETIRKIAQGLGSTEVWVFRGEGEMRPADNRTLEGQQINEALAAYRGQTIELTREQFLLVTLFDKLSATDQEDLIDIAAMKAALKDAE